MTPLSGNLSTAAILSIATALAMDAFAVSLSCGLITRRAATPRILRMPLAFGLFQAGMLAIGWSMITGIQAAIAAVDHWVAFALLLAVGGHMGVSAFRGEVKGERDPLQLTVLFVLALATSIDAFAVGMSLSIVQVPVFTPALVTGVVTFTLSSVAVYIGNRTGPLLGRSAEAAGGLVLIAIGVRILMDHIG
ncbi:MAG: manganese efflux pump MntP family protein [bacterium]|nr:manganese efflux pump MntP family protein [bacterium]MDT8396281.1 manganese efflux pump MntP family protein [bacterium]